MGVPALPSSAIIVTGTTSDNGYPAHMLTSAVNLVVAYTATVTPLIAVQEPVGVTLSSGSDTVNFGIVASGSSVQRTFTILNNGATNLTGIAANITGTNASDFQPGAPGSQTVAPGDSTMLTVTYSPFGIYSSTATLHITSNDPVTPSFDVALLGTGTSGPINLDVGAGTYVGLIQESGIGPGVFDAGFIDLTLLKSGRFTGKFNYAGTTLPMDGAFDGDGNFSTSFGIDLLLSSGKGGASNPAGYWISGFVGTRAGMVPFNAYHAAYARKQAVPEAGKYTILLAATGTLSSIPQGTGYVFVTVAKTGGNVTMKGKLADGTAFTVSGVLVHRIINT